MVEVTFFILLSFLLFKKYTKNGNRNVLVYCGFSLGCIFLVRYDGAIFTLIMLFWILYFLLKKDQKIKNSILFITPIMILGISLLIINYIRFESLLEFGYGVKEGILSGHTTPLHYGIIGLLFSPGAGIFVFSPILVTAFVSYRKLYKIEKVDFLIFLTYIITTLIFFGSFHAWHGFVSWSARYMLPIIPFLLIPLGLFSLNTKKIFPILLGLGGIGVLFNFAWLVQDVSWFVWGLFGEDWGLFDLANDGLGDKPGGFYSLNLNPVVFWTFEHSQLTHALELWFTNLQTDLYLVKAVGIKGTLIILLSIVLPSIIYLIRLNKDELKSNLGNKSKEKSK